MTTLVLALTLRRFGRALLSFFGRLRLDVGDPFEVLHRINYDEPWHRAACREQDCPSPR